MIQVLFVCMGNICRSPAAEAIFRQYVEQEGWEEGIVCRSAGTLGEHVGEEPDPRMIRSASARGYCLSSRARKFTHADFEKYDLIVAMDRHIYRTVESMAVKPEHQEKIVLLGDYHPERDIRDIPDPYHGSSDGFEQVLDMLEVVCRCLLDELASKYNLRT